MNNKEVAEIRRRYNPDKNAITLIRGCYVNEQREVISTFCRSLTLMPQEEAEKYLAIFKRTLSGSTGKNLNEIEFSANQVLDSDEHKLLSLLRNSALADELAAKTFFDKIVEKLTIEGNYLILLMHDAYDVPRRSKDGGALEDSSQVFSYILCSVCPVKLTKPALSYVAADNEFHTNGNDWVVTAPEIGFMFPAFDDRAANIYAALYYTRDTAESHTDFIDAVFNTGEPPMPADAQKEMFKALLGETLAEDCSLDVVQTLNEQLCELIEEHKSDKTNTEPLVVSKGEVRGMLVSAGVPEERLEAFAEKYDEEFGKGTDLSPENIVDAKQFEVRTPDVVIKVSPERADLVETRVIDGVKYVMIRADEGVELNGVSISIND